MINCCSLSCAPEFCFRVPENYVELLSMLPDYSSCVSGRVNYVDRSSNLLHAAPIKHDPYTPDSMDSPSPNAVISSGEVPDIDVDNINESGDNASTLQSAHTSNILRRIDRAVSPALLKSKLELIVRNKRQEAMNAEQDPTDVKRSPSDCRLHSWPDTVERHWNLRANRCNSDVSWQRSHLLTEAWVQGKGQQGYHSFSDFANRSQFDSTPPDDEGIPSDLIIPRIAIINASNFESNESSVYLHDDKYSSYSDNKLSTYSDGRTKSLSADAFSSDKSNEESNRLSSNTEKTIGIKESVYLENVNELMSNEDACLKEDSTKFLPEEKSEEDGKAIKSEVRLEGFGKTAHITDSVEGNIDSENQYELARDEVFDKPSIKNSLPSEELTFQVLQRTQSEHRKNFLNLESTDIGGEPVTAFVTPENVKQCKSNVVNISTDTPNATSDAEIFRCESKQEMLTSKQTTRSNSVQSQDISDNTGNVRLKLKAYKVTERCKKNIVGKKSRCRKCCCIVS